MKEKDPVRVLLVGAPSQYAVKLEQAIESLQLQARVLQTGTSCLSEASQADILVVSHTLPNGSCTMVLSHWLETNGGPSMVLGPPATMPKEIAAYLQMGVSNVLQTVGDIATFRVLLSGYARLVRRDRKLDNMEQRVRVLTYVVISQTILLVALQGPEVVPQLAQWILSLL